MLLKIPFFVQYYSIISFTLRTATATHKKRTKPEIHEAIELRRSDDERPNDREEERGERERERENHSEIREQQL